MSIKTAYQKGRIAYLEELSERGFGNPYMGESYYLNPYVKPNSWDDHDKWSSKAKLWAKGWLECEEEEETKQGK